MIVKNYNIEIKSKETLDIVDITDKITTFLKESKIKNGFVNIQTKHTTATIFLNENEPLLITDIKKNLDQLAKRDIYYAHDDFKIRKVNMCDDECDNGHSHCKALYLPSNLTLNLYEGKLQLGTWQRVLFIELDRKRQRVINVQIMGE
jgi:secondary thiamine-phosphate synthase enzyme